MRKLLIVVLVLLVLIPLCYYFLRRPPAHIGIDANSVVRIMYVNRGWRTVVSDPAQLKALCDAIRSAPLVEKGEPDFLAHNLTIYYAGGGTSLIILESGGNNDLKLNWSGGWYSSPEASSLLKSLDSPSAPAPPAATQEGK